MTDTSSSDENTPVQLDDDAVQSHSDGDATDDVLNDAVSGSESTSAPSPDQV